MEPHPSRMRFAAPSSIARCACARTSRANVTGSYRPSGPSDTSSVFMATPLSCQAAVSSTEQVAGSIETVLEQVFAVAPAEVLELLIESSRRTTAERTEQFGLETTLENQLEQTNTDEISDQVQSTITRDMSVGISANAQAQLGVYSVGGGSDLSVGLSSERSRESIRKRMRTTTRRSSETIRKSFSLTVRSITEIAERSVIRRVIKNETPTPINYGLRRVLRRIRVKVQELGPRLCWQLYVARPGEGLAQSRFVMFREADPVAAPGLPPNAPPRPEGGVESGSQTVAIETSVSPNVVTIALPNVTRHA